jgi:hypothetical protein
MKVRWLLPNLKPYNDVIPALNPKTSHRTRVLLLLLLPKATCCCCSALQQLLPLLLLAVLALRRCIRVLLLLLLLPAGLLPCNPVGDIF